MSKDKIELEIPVEHIPEYTNISRHGDYITISVITGTNEKGRDETLDITISPDGKGGWQCGWPSTHLADSYPLERFAKGLLLAALLLEKGNQGRKTGGGG